MVTPYTNEPENPGDRDNDQYRTPDEESLKEYIVIRVMQLRAESPQDAVTRAEELWANDGWTYYVQEGTIANYTACEVALEGATEVEETHV